MDRTCEFYIHSVMNKRVSLFLASQIQNLLSHFHRPFPITFPGTLSHLTPILFHTRLCSSVLAEIPRCVSARIWWRCGPMMKMERRKKIKIQIRRLASSHGYRRLARLGYSARDTPAPVYHQALLAAFPCQRAPAEHPRM